MPCKIVFLKKKKGWVLNEKKKKKKKKKTFANLSKLFHPIAKLNDKKNICKKLWHDIKN